MANLMKRSAANANVLQQPSTAGGAEAASPFNDARAEALYRAAYDAMLALWPVRPEPLNVQTSFGVTHINAVGPSSAPPIILLAAACASSTEWYAQVVGPLAERHRVYALDTPGDAGLSRPTHAPHCGREFAEWCIALMPLKISPPTVLTDDELRRVDMPRMLLVGEQEVIYKDCSVAFERGQRLMPLLDASWAPGTRHMLPAEQPDLVNSRLRAFLERPAA